LASLSLSAGSLRFFHHHNHIPLEIHFYVDSLVDKLYSPFRTHFTFISFHEGLLLLHNFFCGYVSSRRR
jgi:hypothetical protein